MKRRQFRSAIDWCWYFLELKLTLISIHQDLEMLVFPSLIHLINIYSASYSRELASDSTPYIL